MHLIPTLPPQSEGCFGNGRDSETQNPESTKPKVGFSGMCVNNYLG